jgi:hypothetical protein
MRLRIVVGMSIALGSVSLTTNAQADGSVATYLRDGWDIKAASQVSSTGRTQIILQKGNQGVVCTAYYSATEKGWAPQGCDPLP